MFERRLKIFLVFLFLITIVLIVRAFQLQVIRRSDWNEQALDALKSEQISETTRGTLRDRKGVVIAQDVARIDACVDYRALIDPPDDKWVTDLARAWARQRRADEWRAANAEARKQIVLEEKKHVLDRIQIMFATLARLGDRPLEEIEQTRREIVLRVEQSRRHLWFRKYQIASADHKADREQDPPSWWKRWLVSDAQDAPQLDDFDIKVGEQTDSHPILPAISSDVQNKLGKNIDDFPGLSLRPGLTRQYPQADAACHIVGHLSRVRREDLADDPAPKDELRKYRYQDYIGRTGLEALCEPLLRGTRGRVEKYLGEEGATISSTAPIPGQDVFTALDVDLQQEVLTFFQDANVVLVADTHGTPIVQRQVSVHGGAVLIDLRSNEVLALVSNPTFDANTLDTVYPKLVADKLNQALLNRATQYPRETGSTIKPVVGLGAITQGLLGVNEGIECTGYLMVNGKRYSHGRCWVASKFEATLGINGVSHHPIPQPHQGHDGNADGFLTFADALERSCNIYFETVAARLGLDGLSFWMDKFGLGRPTGIGIEESRGSLPSSYIGPSVQGATWSAGIGQGPISATPIQMANVAATIARDGTWMRPTLLPSAQTIELRDIARKREAAATQPSKTTKWWMIPDQVDLHLAPAALAAAHDGMYRVVNSPAGTGERLRSQTIAIAGKTGTAQAARFFQPVLDENGKEVHEDDGDVKTEPVRPSTADYVNPLAPWYLGFDADGKNLKHAWIIGYAPANNPKVAFAVMVEYGGSGGTVAAQIAKRMLDAAIHRGYLAPDRPAVTTKAE